MSSEHNSPSALDVNGDHLTLETLQASMIEFRGRYNQAELDIPEWQRQIVQAMIEGRTLIVARGRRGEFQRLGEYLTSIGFARVQPNIVESSLMPDDVAMIEPRPDDDFVMASWMAAHAAAGHSQDEAPGMTIDELIPGIAEALAEWKTVRDE